MHKYLSKEKYKTFPLSPNSKKPLSGSNSFHDAVLKCEIPEKHNVGVATGLMNNLLVLDIDIKADKNGFNSLEKEGIDIRVFNTLSVRGPSGGRHYYFRIDEAYSCAIDILEGVDIRADDGYVVGPGSAFNGKFYKVYNSRPIAPLPGVLEKLLLQHREKKGTVSPAAKLDGSSAAADTSPSDVSLKPSDFSGLQNILDKIDPNLGRDGWRNTIWSVFSEYDTNPRTIDILREWSKRSPGKWNKVDFNKVVASFDSSRSFCGLPKCINKYPNKEYYFSEPVDQGVADVHAKEVADSTINYLVKKGNLRLTPKQLGESGENHALELLRSKGYEAEKLQTNAPTYDIRGTKNGKDFFISVKVSREKQHVRLGARRSVLRLEEGNFIFAFMPAEKGGEITTLNPKQYRLLILPAEFVRKGSLPIHDTYWAEKEKDKNGFSVIVKGYGKNHRAIWPDWLTYTDAWHLLP